MLDTVQDVRRDDDADDGPSLDEIIEEGERAIDRVIKGQHFEDWLLIAKAVHMGRFRCMREADTNEPTGKRYNKTFGRWLDEHPKFKKLDPALINQLHELYRHREAIINWRATLGANERAKWNYPETVLRHWKARTQTPKDKPKRKSMSDEVRRLEEENLRLRKENAELREAVGGGAEEQDAEDTDASDAPKLKPRTPKRSLEVINKLFQMLASDARPVRITAADKIAAEIKRGVDLRDLYIVLYTDNKYSEAVTLIAKRRWKSLSDMDIAVLIDRLFPVETLTKARSIVECWYSLIKRRE